MTQETIEDLRAGLEAAALAIEDAAYDLFLVSTKVSSEIPTETVDKIRRLHEHADQLKVYVEELKAGRIVRQEK